MGAQLASLKPLGIPAGTDPRTWRQAIEARVNDLLDQSMALITALDMMDVDPDLEPDEDAESTATETHGKGFVASASDDSEDGGDTEPNGDEIDYDGGEVDAAIPIWGGNEDYRDPGVGLQRF